MFTGIIEEKGKITNIQRGTHSSKVTVEADLIFSDLKLGDSVATNGVCLTVASMTSNTFTADVMHESLKYSSLGSLAIGHIVNLERAMSANGRFGGHIVSGHIDGTGTVKSIQKDDNAIIFTIAAAPHILKYIVKKGSIAIDGISLTVTNVTDTDFSVSIIPHTLGETVLAYRKSGDIVNLEVDMMAKYIEKMLGLQADTGKKESKLTAEFLMSNGF